MYKAIVFDLDDTLYNYSAIHDGAIIALREYTCSRYGVTYNAFDCAFQKAREDTKLLLNNTGASHNRMLYCQKTLENLGKNVIEGSLEMYEIYWGYILDHMKLRAGAKEVLKECNEMGIQIGVCSDLTAYIQHRKLRKLGIGKYIDAIVTSEEAGAEKPASSIFKLILEKLKVKPNEALFIGDSLRRDVEGAIAMGLDACWFHDGKPHEGYRTVSSFRDIRGIIHDC